MPSRCFAFLIAFAASLSIACNQKGDPPPQFNSILTDGDTRLTPVRLVKRDKAALVAPAAGSETPITPAGGPGAREAAADAVIIDDSTAEAAARSFVSILKSGNLARLAEIIVPEQREALEQLVQLVEPLQEAQAELQKAIDQKFPGHAFRMAGTPGSLRNVQIVAVTEAGEDEATATLQVEGQQDEELKLRKVEGKWRVESTEVAIPPEDKLQQLSQMLTNVGDAIKDVAAKVNDGTITDIEAISQELAQATNMPAQLFAVVPADGSDAGGDEGNESPATEDGTTPSDNTAAPDTVNQETPAPDAANQTPDATAQPREREAVDEVYSGPNMLRAR